LLKKVFLKLSFRGNSHTENSETKKSIAIYVEEQRGELLASGLCLTGIQGILVKAMFFELLRFPRQHLSRSMSIRSSCCVLFLPHSPLCWHFRSDCISIRNMPQATLRF